MKEKLGKINKLLKNKGLFLNQLFNGSRLDDISSAFHRNYMIRIKDKYDYIMLIVDILLDFGDNRNHKKKDIVYKVAEYMMPKRGDVWTGILDDLQFYLYIDYKCNSTLNKCIYNLLYDLMHELVEYIYDELISWSII